MSGESSSAAAWSTRLQRIRKPEMLLLRADDPRLGEIIEFWQGNPDAVRPGRAVLVGFPLDQGVKRNHGRSGAARAPHEIRQALYRLVPWDGATGVDLTSNPPLDLGDVPGSLPLEEAQLLLGELVGFLLRHGAVPIVLGGGHETAYGHYLGYVAAERPVGIINIDAHLDVRPCLGELGHSGSPFRQALEHPTRPLGPARYVCLGAQPGGVAREHWRYLNERGGTIRWAAQVDRQLSKVFAEESKRLATQDCSVYLTIDGDSVRAADVPGVSAPNVVGLSGSEVIACAQLAGRSSEISSIDLVEINPQFDRDGLSARWAALLVWSFLVGLALRPHGDV